MPPSEEEKTRRIRRRIRRSEKRVVERHPALARRDAIGATLAAIPFYSAFAVVLVSYCICHAELALGLTPSLVLQALYPTVSLLAVAWVFPNYLRQAALQIVSSNVHYCEDVRSIHEETQVLHPFYL